MWSCQFGNNIFYLFIYEVENKKESPLINFGGKEHINLKGIVVPTFSAVIMS
jgi:hypothetical protein